MLVEEMVAEVQEGIALRDDPDIVAHYRIQLAAQSQVCGEESLELLEGLAKVSCVRLNVLHALNDLPNMANPLLRLSIEPFFPEIVRARRRTTRPRSRYRH